MRPMHRASTTLFLIAFIISLIGFFMEGTMEVFMFAWTALLIIAGWIIHIIGIVKR